MHKRLALETLSRIAGKVKGPDAAKALAGARGLIESIFDPRTPSFRLGFRELRSNLIVAGSIWSHIPQDDRPALTELHDELVSILHTRGYRKLSHILTLQEDLLRGASHPGEGITTEHVPLGILGGDITPEEARKARELQGCVNTLFSYHDLPDDSPLIVDEVWLPVSLEPLNSNNETERDPQVVRIVGDSLVTVPGIAQAHDFPFSRRGKYLL